MNLKSVLSLALLGACLPMAAGDDDETAHLRRSFAWQAQFNQPVRDFREAMDTKTGLGLGVQWQRYRGNGILHRTRLEWNVYPESPEVGPQKARTQATNVILSFDRLFYFRTSGLGPFIAGGMGVGHWMVDETRGAHRDSWRTNKLNLMAGVGFQFTSHIAMEARYQVASVRDTFDGNSVQVAAVIRY